MAVLVIVGAGLMAAVVVDAAITRARLRKERKQAAADLATLALLRDRRLKQQRRPSPPGGLDA